ncbi:hypothetical protein FACS189447_10860 [Spirochaetia bacterium]|nr:hypothetical protein FACS189447_10860 [Spirochaetia bacterium]
MANYEKLDFWSLKAQKEGYPARSIYKLKEMDEKFGLLKRGMKVLDLGAAPGSWSLYVLRKMASWGEAANAGRPASALVSIDLAPLSRVYDQGLFDRSNFFFIQGDMTFPENTESILSHAPYNLVVSDAAPATTGNRSVDTLRPLTWLKWPCIMPKPPWPRAVI